MINDTNETGFAVVNPDEVEDVYAGTEVPGEFRSLTEALGCSQLAVTCIRIPAHSDFEQGTGHCHDEIEELYLVIRGVLTMRFGDRIQQVAAPAAVRVNPTTLRSHRNETDEPVEMWAVSRKLERKDANKLDNFWEASEKARQTAR